jgi:hypothetical protein
MVEMTDVLLKRYRHRRPYAAIAMIHLLGACRAGGIPPVAFLAGGRVDAFVDDRVVAIAALDEVSPHGDVLRRLVTVGVVWYARWPAPLTVRHRQVDVDHVGTLALAGDEARAMS